MSDVNELAHIIGQSSDGPRGQNALPLSQRDDSANPLSESFKQWQRHVIMTILPNNRRVEALLVR